MLRLNENFCIKVDKDNRIPYYFDNKGRFLSWNDGLREAQQIAVNLGYVRSDNYHKFTEFGRSMYNLLQ